jgi:CPA1 family monovalent cation:H+ antiporter
VVLGLVLGRLYFAALVRVRDWAASVVLQFLGTFAMWLLADALHLSAVLTLVAFAMVLARYGPERMGARDRRATYAVWEAAIFALNILAFIMIGLQLRGVTARLDGAIWHSLGFAAAVLATAILVRLAWVMTYVGFLIWKNRHFAVAGRPPRAALQTGPTFQTGLVVSWCGMRGIVTLAAALALPPTFPYRDLIVFTAFCVVLGTLVLQGATLRPLLRRLTLPRDDSMKREKLLARAEAARAALAALEGHRDEQAAQLLVQEYESLLRDPSIVRADPTGVGALRSRALAAERDCLAALRRKGRIGDDVFHLIEEELDWLQAEFDPHPR